MSEKTYFPHACATCSDLPSSINTMIKLVRSYTFAFEHTGRNQPPNWINLTKSCHKGLVGDVYMHAYIKVYKEQGIFIWQVSDFMSQFPHCNVEKLWGLI